MSAKIINREVQEEGRRLLLLEVAVHTSDLLKYIATAEITSGNVTYALTGFSIRMQASVQPLKKCYMVATIVQLYLKSTQVCFFSTLISVFGSEKQT